MTCVSVVTSTRADWGLLKPLCQRLQQEPDVELKLIVTGTHLSTQFGDTLSEIKEDGFRECIEVPFIDNPDDSMALLASVAMSRFALVFSQVKPDLVIVLGDRFEILSVAYAAYLSKVPVVHLHGGELTQGAMDDAIRHCLTKLASMHFVSTDEYRKRVIQLGEQPSTVYVSGALGLENIIEDACLSSSECFESLGLDVTGDFAMLTYHPETLGESEQCEQLDQILETLIGETSLCIVGSYPNVDLGGSKLISRLNDWQSRYPDRIFLVASFGRRRYLSLVKHSQFVIGNSSSGILEVPSLKVPTINVGDRQKGRIRASSVIDAGETSDSLIAAINTVLSFEFKQKIQSQSNPYHVTRSPSEFIIQELRMCNYRPGLLKEFYDIPFKEGVNVNHR